MKISPALEGTILQLTREQLLAVLQQDPRTNAAGLFRASDDALRSAVRTYVRMDRLTDSQINQAKGGL